MVANKHVLFAQCANVVLNTIMLVNIVYADDT